jgi:uncharacterized protein YkwD
MLAIALVLGLLVLAGAAFAGWRFMTGEQAADWKPFASTEGGFTVLLPAKAAQKEQADPKIVGANKIREVSAELPAARQFSVQFYDLTDRPINDYLYFSWLKNHLLDKGGKLAREQEVASGAYPCREITVDLADDQLLIRRIYLAEARVFLVTAVGPKSPIAAPETQKFFESFKITSVPKAKLPPPTAVAAANLKEPVPAAAPKKPPDPPPGAKAEPEPAPKNDPPPAKDPPPVAKVEPVPMPEPKKDDPPPVAKVDPAPAPKEEPPPVAKAEPMPMPKKDPPAVAKGDPPPVKSPDAKVDLNPEERALVDALNRFRKSKKVAELQPLKELIVGARKEAEEVAKKKATKQLDYGFLNIFHLSVPMQQAVSAQQLVEQLTLTKSLRVQLADEDLRYIGVGISISDGVTYYMLIMGGSERHAE